MQRKMLTRLESWAVRWSVHSSGVLPTSGSGGLSPANLSKPELPKPRSEGCPDPWQLMVPEATHMPVSSHWGATAGEVLGIQRERDGSLSPNKIATWRGDSRASLTTPQRTAHRASAQEQPRSAQEQRRFHTGGSLELRLRCSEWEEGGGT